MPRTLFTVVNSTLKRNCRKFAKELKVPRLHGATRTTGRARRRDETLSEHSQNLGNPSTVRAAANANM